MTLNYLPVATGQVPAHVRDAFAEKCDSKPPAGEANPAPGWHWQSQEGSTVRHHWIRSRDGLWSRATVRS